MIRHLSTRRARVVLLPRGFTILESLVALLIFSFGVLALVGLQAASVQQTSISKYRSDANLLADELIGQMWASDRITANMQTNFGTGGPAYNAWYARVRALPGAAGNAPTVVIDNNARVTISVFWRMPGEPATQPAHRHTVVTQIR